MAVKSDTGSVYGLSCACHPHRGVMYVGQTIRKVEERLSGHLSDAIKRSRDYPVHRWIRKHGTDNILTRTLETVERSFLDDCEITWISNFDTYRRKDKLNQTPGGGQGVVFDDEIRSRMSESAIKRWSNSDPITREARVAVLRNIAGSSNRGVPMSDEQKRKLSEKAKLRPPISDDTREKMRASWAVEKRLPTSGPGEKNGRATITEKTALEIHGRLVSGERVSEISRDLGLAYHIVSAIKSGGAWNHITGLPKSGKRKSNG